MDNKLKFTWGYLIRTGTQLRNCSHDPGLQEPDLAYRSPVKIDYIELEQANRVLGTTGEQLAFRV